jgi:hypothetical protein
MKTQLSQEAYAEVCERILQAMCWQGILVPAGLAERHAAEIIALIELDLAHQASFKRHTYQEAA